MHGSQDWLADFSRLVWLKLLAAAIFLTPIPVLSSESERPPERTPVMVSEGLLAGNESMVSSEGLLGNEDNLLGGEGDLLGSEGDLLGSEGDLLGSEGDLLGSEEDLLGSEDDLLGSEDDLLGSEDDLLGSEDDLLGSEDEFLPQSDGLETTSSATRSTRDNAAANHLALFAENRYPSANTCKVCHPKHYDEWSVSQHAYAQLSPVYMAMQRTINAATSNTNGDFCIRCHNQVGMNLGESTAMNNLDRHPTSREGITCVVCHRVNMEYGKVSGRVALEQGGLLTPVYGPLGDGELNRVLENRDQYRVVTEEDKSGRKIHTEVGQFTQLSESSFCGTCHDVNLFNGFRLEEAFSQYKNSPAAAKGISCQDCHMGKVQGEVSGYEHGPAAVVGGVETAARKLTNHFFAGPDYSVIHPGLFPHNAEAAEMATMREWLTFRYKEGWGTDAFENDLPDVYEFPERWRAVDDRYDAREILDRQFKLLNWAEEKRYEVLRAGYKLGAIRITKNSQKGLKFEVDVTNGTDGHPVPTGFDAERLVWLQVTVKDESGQVIYESGDLDPNGDLRDAHSLYVHNGDLPLDKDLFSLQSKFITRNVRGGEREQVLAVNYSNDPLPFVRPFTRSLALTGQPAGARKHRLTIPPLATRTAKYHVKSKNLDDAYSYRLNVQLKTAMIPVNLLDAIQGVGFDYNMSAKEIAEGVVAGHQVLWEKDLMIRLGSTREQFVTQREAMPAIQ